MKFKIAIKTIFQSEREVSKMEKRIEQLEWELKYKEEQLEEVRKTLYGTIEVTGNLENYFGSGTKTIKTNRIIIEQFGF